MIQFTAKVSCALGAIAVDLPYTVRDAVYRLLDKSESLHAGYVTLRIDLPQRPRTTGPHSQNNFAHGACADIAPQLTEARGRVYTKDEVYYLMKSLAVREGYPTYYEPEDDSVRPKKLSLATIEEAAIVNRTITKYADENGFYLTRVDENGVPYHSIGGRTRKEMEIL